MKKIATFFAGSVAVLIPLSMFTCCLSFDQNAEWLIDPKLKTHVDMFFAEAERRDIHIDKDNLVIRVEPHANVKDAGVSIKCGCQRIVLIADDSYDYFASGKWLKGDSAYYGLENLVFHELGHSILQRKHCECPSIMDPGSSMLVYAKDMVKRKQLIDELFGKIPVDRNY